MPPELLKIWSKPTNPGCLPTYRWNACKFEKTGTFSLALEHFPRHYLQEIRDWNIFPGIISSTALATQHLIRRAPSDKMAVISTLVLIFVSRGWEAAWASALAPPAYSEIRKLWRELLKLIFINFFCDCHSCALTFKTRNWCDTGFKFY